MTQRAKGTILDTIYGINNNQPQYLTDENGVEVTAITPNLKAWPPTVHRPPSKTNAILLPAQGTAVAFRSNIDGHVYVGTWDNKIYKPTESQGVFSLSPIPKVSNIISALPSNESLRPIPTTSGNITFGITINNEDWTGKVMGGGGGRGSRGLQGATGATGSSGSSNYATAHAYNNDAGQTVLINQDVVFNHNTNFSNVTGITLQPDNKSLLIGDTGLYSLSFCLTGSNVGPIVSSLDFSICVNGTPIAGTFGVNTTGAGIQVELTGQALALLSATDIITLRNDSPTSVLIPNSSLITTPTVGVSLKIISVNI